MTFSAVAVEPATSFSSLNMFAPFFFVTLFSSPSISLYPRLVSGLGQSSTPCATGATFLHGDGKACSGVMGTATMAAE